MRFRNAPGWRTSADCSIGPRCPGTRRGYPIEACVFAMETMSGSPALGRARGAGRQPGPTMSGLLRTWRLGQSEDPPPSSKTRRGNGLREAGQIRAPGDAEPRHRAEGCQVELPPAPRGTCSEAASVSDWIWARSATPLPQRSAPAGGGAGALRLPVVFSDSGELRGPEVRRAADRRAEGEDLDPDACETVYHSRGRSPRAAGPRGADSRLAEALASARRSQSPTCSARAH